MTHNRSLFANCWLNPVTRPLTALVLGVIGSASAPASAIDLGIENDAEYAQLISAMRAAEYVRSDVIVAQNPKPRVYAVLAGVMAYSERNPNASEAQIGAYIASMDAAVQMYAPMDPDLNEPAAFYAALRFAIVDEPELAGTDTAVGKRALALLGVTVPDPDGFESIQRRMVRYELALARPLDYRNELFDLLVSGFFGVDPAGNERATLPAMLDAYFEAQGFDPELGGVRDDRANVNAGLAILPADYAGYELAISMGDENIALRDAVNAELESVRVHIDGIVGTNPMADDGSLDFALASAPGLAESVDLAMNDPAYVQQVFDDLRASLEATAQARAAASAASYLMLQSDFAEIEEYATYTRDYSSISLQTSDDLSTIQSGVSIAGNLAIGIAGFYTGDPLTAAGGFLSAVTEAIGLAGVLNAGPSVDEQIFDQVVALRMQVEQMRQEMNERFDRIDRQLNIMYSTIISGFNAIGDQIGDLQSDVDAISRDLAVARSQLRRLEAALYGVVQDILLTDLTNETNVVLDYRDENGIDLPYSGGSPDFITASESFFTYATLTSLSEAFVGSRSNPTVTIDNAEEYIGDGPVSAYLNDLAVLPQSLGLPALAASDLPGIEPWSQAASAYAQLARENPWYFAYRYGRQLEDYNSDPQNESLPELDRILVSGDQLMSFVEAIRATDVDGNSALFAALVENYKDAAANFQAQIDAEIEAILPAFLTNNGVRLDLWAQGPQEDISTVIPNLPAFDVTSSSLTLAIPYSAIQEGGFGTFASQNNADEARLLRAWYLAKKALAPDPDAFRPRAWVTNWSPALNDFRATFWIGDREMVADGPTYKTLRFSFDTFFGFVWFPYFGNSTAEGLIAFRQVWGHEPTSNFLDDQTTNSLNLPSSGSNFENSNYRVRITGRSNLPPVEAEEVQRSLFPLRAQVHNHLLLELFDSNSELSQAALELDRAEAVLDAYVTVGLPKELNQSEVLRSALRAFPGTSELGLGSVDMIALIDGIDQDDRINDWADQTFNVSNIEQILSDRIELVHDEIKRGLQRPAVAPDYVGWTIAELAHLRDTAFKLAVDDTYVTQAGSMVSVSATEGVLANDIDQEYRAISIDTAYVFDAAYIAPSNGSVMLHADGSFQYQADPGFEGSDSFTYRSMTMIPGVGQPVYSQPATVVITVSSGACSIADLTGDGELDFFDVSTFLVAFNAEDSVADLNSDGEFNFFDVSEFLVAYSQGCP